MRQNFFLALILFTLVPAFTFTQCKETPRRELMMLDTLDTIIVRTRDNLKYDLVTLNNRKTRMDEDRNLIIRFYADTVDNEIGQIMTRYKGISKIYGQFISGYQDVYNAMIKSKNQSEALRNSVKDHQLSKEEFKKYYNEEKAIALDNFKRSQQISVHIPEVEPDYQRVSKKVDDLLLFISEKLMRTEKDSTLFRILRSRE